MAKIKELIRIVLSMMGAEISDAVGIITTCFVAILIAPFVPIILLILLYSVLQAHRQRQSLPSVLVVIPHIRDSIHRGSF
jgi:Na+/serine symporter